MDEALSVFRTYLDSIVSMSDESFDICKNFVEFHEVEKNEVLVRAGEKCNFIYFVANGSLRNYHMKDGNEVNTCFCFENSIACSFESFVHGTVLEIIWTVIPSFILIIVALPSFALLYSIDEIIEPTITIKCVGHQWFWSYEFSDFELKSGNINFDSYMIAEDELEFGELRLLEVDNRVVLPLNTHIRILVTAADVLHSWAVPSLGIKVDACAGRLNQTSVFILRSGVFYGQCSEICGVGHGNMPIVVEAVSTNKYIAWLAEKF